LVVWLGASCVVASITPPANAQQPQRSAAAQAASRSVVVLSLESEDAEDQAEAMSGAFRSRVRTAPKWTLNEAATSLSLLTAALKCPANPDPPCLQKIGDQVKVDHFFWGVMTKTPPNKVTAEVHLWTRGKPEQVTTETFSDNLRDQNDEILRRIAGKIFEKLTTGTTTSGELIVSAGEVDGTLFIDGMPQGQVEHGRAIVEVKPGSHVVEVKAEGYDLMRQPLIIRPGADLMLDLHPVRSRAAPPPEKPSRPISARLVIELSMIGVGLGFAVAGTVEGVHFLALQADNKADHTALRADDFCNPGAFHTATDQQLSDACGRITPAKSARTAEIILYGIGAFVGGTGLAFLLGDPSIRSGEKTSASLKSGSPTVHFAPRVGPGSNGLDLVGTF
ncbi:MAG: hypothetical protein ABIP89_20705, partial [Polyangiaceae bacterium]